MKKRIKLGLIRGRSLNRGTTVPTFALPPFKDLSYQTVKMNKPKSKYTMHKYMASVTKKSFNKILWGTVMLQKAALQQVVNCKFCTHKKLSYQSLSVFRISRPLCENFLKLIWPIWKIKGILHILKTCVKEIILKI